MVGVDDEDRAHRRGVAGAGVDHVVELGHGAVGVGDDREVEVGAADLTDVGGPGAVVLDRVDRDGDGLGVPSGELRVEGRGATEFGGAHRGEVGGVAEQHRPGVGLPVVEVDLTLGGVGVEVGCGVSESQAHRGSPLVEWARIGGSDRRD